MLRTSQEAYDGLIRRVKAVSLLGSCGAVLHWDHQTYMPPKGGGHRAEQLALLAGLCHERFTDPEIGDLLSLAETGELERASGSAAAVNLREIRRAYDRATRIPAALVQELARTSTLAQGVNLPAHLVVIKSERATVSSPLHSSALSPAGCSRLSQLLIPPSVNTNATN